jgi:hypothetical protein
VRHAGNRSLHIKPDIDDIMVLVLDPENDAIGELLFSTINMVVDEAITRPAEAERLVANLPEGAKAAIARRDAAKGE